MLCCMSPRRCVASAASTSARSVRHRKQGVCEGGMKELLASYGLLDGELPPTLLTSLWHGGFSASRNPFAMCYYSHYPSLRISEEERKRACEYLKRFGRTREEQIRNYYLWTQTVPRPLWRYFAHLPLTHAVSRIQRRHGLAAPAPRSWSRAGAQLP
jgi:hypothetical protein